MCFARAVSSVFRVGGTRKCVVQYTRVFFVGWVLFGCGGFERRFWLPAALWSGLYIYMCCWTAQPFCSSSAVIIIIIITVLHSVFMVHESGEHQKKTRCGSSHDINGGMYGLYNSIFRPVVFVCMHKTFDAAPGCAHTSSAEQTILQYLHLCALLWRIPTENLSATDKIMTRVFSHNGLIRLK